MPSMSDVSEIAACPPSPIANDASAIPSSTSSPFSKSITLLPCSPDASPCMPTVGLYYCTFQAIIRLKIFSLFFCVFFLMYYFCEKHCKPITVQYYTANC